MRSCQRLLQPVVAVGVGVHGGQAVRARLLPAAPGSGLVINGKPAGLAHACARPGASWVGEVSTVEHLLAALYALGISDCQIKVAGGELPILDGSAAPWCVLLREAGLAPCMPRPAWVVRTPVVVEAHGGWARFDPDPRCVVEVEVDYGEGGPRGQAQVAIDDGGRAFEAEVAWARTFVRVEQVVALRAAGRGAGATPHNTVLWPEAALRGPDEPVRHKLLDAIGDLALLGTPLQGRLTVHHGSHALHHAVIAALVAARPPSTRG